MKRDSFIRCAANALLAVALMSVAAGPARGTDYNWINAAGGLFEQPLDWSPFPGPPGPDDRAIFNIAGTYEVDFFFDQTNEDLLVRAGTVTFDLAANVPSTYKLDGGLVGVYVGVDSGDDAHLLLKNPGGVLSSPAGARIGENAGSIGKVTADGGTWNNLADLFVGNFGNGKLVINTDGEVTNTRGHIANAAGAMGKVTIDGGTWTQSSSLTVGISGNGELTIHSGAVSNSDGFIGNNMGAVGNVTVNGGTWTNSANLFVGVHEGGDGRLTINGGEVQDVKGVVGFRSGATGLVTVDGGTWTNSSNLEVGFEGDGEVVIHSGQVTNPAGYLGLNAGSTGKATVNGGMWNNAADLYVGASGGGEMVIDGGAVTNTFGYVGHNAGSTGKVTVDSGTWTNSGNLDVGRSGSGEMVINGGEVINAGGYVGRLAGSTGNVTVNGGTWTNTGVLWIALSGSGQMVINGGLVSNLFGSIGVDPGTKGKATVNGGTWTTTNSLNVASSGQGDLEILTGGVVQVGLDVSVGGFGTGIGTILVDNPGSRWEIGDDLRLGGNEVFVGGTGSLTIGNGATVDVADVTQLWPGGTLLLNGGTFRTGTLTDSGGTLLLHQGKLEITDSLTISPPAPMGDTLNIGPGLSVVVSDPHTQIEADGQIAVTGSTAAFTAVGTTGQNDGVISVAGGSLTYTDRLVQNGILSVVNATVNGSVHNLVDGDVVVSGVTTFNEIDPADEFINDGEVHVAGTAIFNIDVSGSGDFSLTGTTIFNKSYNPGSSPGHNAFDGAIMLGGDAHLILELGGRERGDTYDAIDVAESFTAAGTLTIALLDGFTPHAGDTFDLLDFDSAAGAFETILLPKLEHGLRFDTTSLLTTGSVSVVPEPAATGVVVAGVAATGLRRRRRS